MNKVDVLVGLQFGDEGKGKVINAIANNYDIIVRYQGGANSGHTVYDEDGGKVVFNTIPSGMIGKNVIGVITHGVVINPYAFKEEIDRLSANKYMSDIKDRLVVSSDVNITIPTHILIDIFSERQRDKSGSKIGSTNRGNTPTYSDKVARRGVKLRDIKATEYSWDFTKVDALMEYHIKYITSCLDVELNEIHADGLMYGMSLAEYTVLWKESIKTLMSLVVVNTSIYLNDKLSRGKRILLEAAQGAMLDLDYGTYPYVTSTSVTAPSAFAMSGIPAQFAGKILGVMKPYITRVGSGFFPTEILESNTLDWPKACKIVEVGGEFGSVTGRRRKIGWLDIPQLRYACMINGITDIIVCKADVMSSIDTMSVCHAYVDNAEFSFLAEEYDIYSGNTDVFAKMRHMESFGRGVCGLQSVPDNSKLAEFLVRIEEYLYDLPTSPKITAVSVSPKSEMIIKPKSGW